MREEILIIDDDEDWANDILPDVLSELGVQFRIASDPKTAVKEIEQGKNNLLLITLDMNLGGGSYEGERLLRYIHKNCTNIPCVIISGSPITPDKSFRLSRDYSMVRDYFVKSSFDFEFVKQRINNIIISQKQSTEQDFLDPQLSSDLELIDVNTEKMVSDINHVNFRQFIMQYFNITELRTLCFDLKVDYEGLAGESKEDKVRELLSFFERRGRILELVEICRQLRPNNSDLLNL